MRPHCWAAPKHTHKACQLRGAAARPGGTQTHADIRRLQASSVTVWPQQAAAVDAPPLELCRRSQLLAEWVEEAGGYVHPSLAVVLTTRDCGCRGIVATQAISADELNEVPLIAVPERLYMTTEHAQALLRNTSSSVSEQLSGVLQLALLLAHERSKGSCSFWAPYIRSLPDEPPVAWLQPAATRAAQLQQLTAAGMANLGDWDVAAQRAAERMRQEALRAVSMHGTRLGVGTEDVVWAAAQVVSRAFGRGTDIGMAPFIDLCNHRLDAAPPSLWIDEQADDEPIVYITSPKELQQGDEVYVSYLTGCSPLTAWLNFGFVPPELYSGDAWKADLN